MIAPELVFVSRRGNEMGQLVRASRRVFFIENALGKTAKESRRTIFENIAARTEQRGVWIEFAA